MGRHTIDDIIVKFFVMDPDCARPSIKYILEGIERLQNRIEKLAANCYERIFLLFTNDELYQRVSRTKYDTI